MSRIATFLAAMALAGTVAAVPAIAQQTRSDQAQARQEMQAGNAMSVREIEARTLPRMQGYDYLGFEYDGVAGAYRLKFIREGKVTFVDVDARSGRIINRSR
jgi:uncharacterized membrane protein YkoI